MNGGNEPSGFRRLRCISRLAEKMLDSSAGLRPGVGYSYVFVGVSSSPVPRGYCSNPARSFVSLSVLFTFLNEASFTYLIQQLTEGDRNLAVVSHTIQRLCRIINRAARNTHGCLVHHSSVLRAAYRRERGLRLVGIADVSRIVI